MRRKHHSLFWNLTIRREGIIIFLPGHKEGLVSGLSAVLQLEDNICKVPLLQAHSAKLESSFLNRFYEFFISDNNGVRSVLFLVSPHYSRPFIKICEYVLIS